MVSPPRSKSLARRFPRVAAEWHPTKNGGHGPDQVWPHTSRTAWWRCPKDPKHVWRGIIAVHTDVCRRNGTGCQRCLRATKLAAASLAARDPAVAAEWHPTKNGKLRPDRVLASNRASVWWQCSFDPRHVWRAALHRRALGGSGCPLCRGRPAKGGSLADLRPDVAAQWHPTANAPLTPAHVKVRSGKRVTWACPAGASHVWQTRVCERTKAEPSGCPMCARRRLTTETSLLACHPEIAREWHPTKNGALGPADVVPGSGRKVWWRCRRDSLHIWQAVVDARIRHGTGCPACAHRVVTWRTSLLVRFPRLAKEWHPTKNGALGPADVVPGSAKRVWWRCRRDPSHEWSSKVVNRTRKAKPTGCPACAGLVVTPATSLSALFPKLAKEWHPTKNPRLRPEDVTPGSKRGVWWQCRKDPAHAWRARIASRTTPPGNGCPLCSGRRVSATNSLAARFPEIAAEWHPTKNGRLRPDLVVAGSPRGAWWQCRKNPAHQWRAGVNDRTGPRRGGCPGCSNKMVTEDNCLLAQRPELAREWHPSKNGPLTPADVTPGSAKKVWWRCALNRAHEWEAFVYSRSSRTGGTGCPQCHRDSRTRRALRGTEVVAPDRALRAGRRGRA